MKNNLKFNSAICTSREQSERLLALGLKRETSDMHYYCIVCNEFPKYMLMPTNPKIPLDTPAWSLHRLIEIAQLPQSWQCLSGDWYNEIIAYIQSMIHINQFNKEYLE